MTTPSPVPDAITAALIQLAARCHARGWALATSGNFSVRLDEGRFLITASGRDKGALEPGDLLVVDLAGNPEGPGRPSAETALHAALYRRRPAVGAVAHTHSVAAAVLSRAHAARGELRVTGYEMQKAIAGVTTHEATVRLPIFANDQDVPRLARVTDEALGDDPFIPGYLIAGHGLYTWGRDAAEAGRHAEGLEFLLECALHERA
jgi:methylthioribulose-1-phosphate dehydratase